MLQFGHSIQYNRSALDFVLVSTEIANCVTIWTFYSIQYGAKSEQYGANLRTTKMWIEVFHKFGAVCNKPIKIQPLKTDSKMKTDLRSCTDSVFVWYCNEQHYDFADCNLITHIFN